LYNKIYHVAVMMNPFLRKILVVILGGISLLVLIYLIASLGGLILQPAKPFAYIENSKDISIALHPNWNGLIYIFYIVAALLVVLIFLLPPDQRKRLLIGLARLAIIGLVIYFLFSQLGSGGTPGPRSEPTDQYYRIKTPGPTVTPAPGVTPAVYIPPGIPPWTSYLAGLLILGIIAGGWGWMAWRGSKKKAPYQSLAEIARSALSEIDEGKDWGDAILNAYHRMNGAVAHWRGIHRQAGMTPAEFADFLTSAQLPGEAVRRLTSLFERVRYGSKSSTKADIKEAVECLTAIMNYCQETR
jgi:hypothetical protein